MSLAAEAWEGARVGGAEADGGRVGAEAGAGGVGGEVTRRRFCGAAGTVLGGDGPTWPGLPGPLRVSGVSGRSAFRSGGLAAAGWDNSVLAGYCALGFTKRPHNPSRGSRTAVGEAGGRP